MGVGKASKKVCSTVMRSGVHVIVLVAIVVDHARESVRIMTDVASLKLDIVNETAKKGLVLTESVKVEMMMVKEKFALAVKVVVHASVSADNEGCGRESTGECKGYCEEKYG